MAEPVTLEMVALEAGVSTATVSRIINGTGKVSPRRRKLVMDAIQKLGYRPNLVAQSLARGQSMNIGVLTQDISSPFFSQIHKGIEQGLQGSGYHPIFVSEEWRDDKQHTALEVLLSRRVDALIVLGGYIEDESLMQLSAQLPLVMVGREVAGLNTHCLCTNNRLGGKLATQHLIRLGHRNIAYLSGPETHPDAVDRLAGYMDALQEAGLPLQRKLVMDGHFSEEGGMRATEKLLSLGLPFSAVFAANDQAALGAQLVLQQRGLRIPADVSVVGFDDLPSSAFSYPPLTTVRQPALKMGKAAAQYTLALLEDRWHLAPHFEVELVVRESTGPARDTAVNGANPPAKPTPAQGPSTPAQPDPTPGETSPARRRKRLSGAGKG